MSELVSMSPLPGEPQYEVSDLQFRPGSWWKLKHAFTSDGVEFKSGTYFLCSEIKYAHGSPHTIIIGQPPSSISEEVLMNNKRVYPWSWSWIVSEFLEKFESAPEAEAIASRDAEIAEINSGISQIQSDISRTQRDLSQIANERSNPIGLLAGPNVESVTPADRGALAIKMQADLVERRAALTAATEGLQIATQKMQAKSAKLSLYYKERSDAAIASVTPIIAVAARLQEHVDTMGLYVGTGIEAKLLIDGRSADSSEKLHLWQRKLFMDEEILIHLLDGGADYSDFGTFVEMLKADATLVERIFGAPRAVVVMACRRNAKDRDTSDSSGVRGILDKISKEVADKEAFLLIRDGQKIWEVSLPSFLTSTERMFPTPDDLEAPYREKAWYDKEPARVIGQDSVKYADAVETFRKLALQYERLLLVLWGLHDRLGIFGPFAEGASYQSFADPRLQQERFTMVMDDQFVIGTNRPSYRDWIVQKNKSLKPGSRIMAVWKNIMTPETAPMVVEDYFYNGRHSQNWKYIPDSNWDIVTVKRGGADLYVEAPVHREIYSKDKTRHINAKVTLRPGYVDSSTGFGLLVLDDVDHEDLDYYLGSRSERPHYLRFAAVLVAARDALRADALEEAPASAWLKAAARSAGFYEKARADIVDRAVRVTLRGWRTERGSAPPEVGSHKWRAASELLLKKIWHVLGHDDDELLIEGVRHLVEAQLNETPIRLVRDGVGRLVCFSTPSTAAVAKEELMIGRWPYINRHIIKVSASGSVDCASTTEVLPFLEAAGETEVKNFAPRAEYGPLVKFGMSPALLRGSLTIAESLFNMENAILDKDLLDTKALRNLCYETQHEVLNRDSRHFNRAGMLLPIGIGSFEKVSRDDYDRKEAIRTLSLFCLLEDAYEYLARHSETGRTLAVSSLTRIYSSSERQINALPSVGSLPSLTFVKMPLKKATLEKMSDEIACHGYSLKSSSAVDRHYASIPRWNEALESLRSPDEISKDVVSCQFHYVAPEAMARLKAILTTTAPTSTAEMAP